MSTWPGTRLKKSTGNAFSGVIPHYVPMSAMQQYRSPLYSRWHHLHKSSPSAPTWADFRASQDAPAKRATVELKQYPGLLSPLSLRSQQQVQRKVSIRIDSATEHQASMTKRQKLAKAAI